ncbi:class I SAM-dependent methyltransferase [Campylobacter fetus]|uniref:class I SAM-dependent methyltransferase n=1 Tax=Campylobacter fetus TaxID=196 RepID=UPI0021AF9ED8|nr:class I SAM-dependent methyltransferase [Campylobacter fetus]
MKKTFSFGKNWLRYVKYILNENIIQNASNSLTKFISNSEFKNKIFIDIGCGSGLFSLCALRLGAKKVISFDIDLNSVQAANLCKQKFAPDSTNWDILQGSILDLNFLKNLELALKNEQIIVYSWGVLHHTNDLNSAMSNAANLAKLGGGYGIHSNL